VCPFFTQFFPHTHWFSLPTYLPFPSLYPTHTQFYIPFTAFYILWTWVLTGLATHSSHSLTTYCLPTWFCPSYGFLCNTPLPLVLCPTLRSHLDVLHICSLPVPRYSSHSQLVPHHFPVGGGFSLPPLPHLDSFLHHTLDSYASKHYTYTFPFPSHTVSSSLVSSVPWIHIPFLSHCPGFLGFLCPLHWYYGCWFFTVGYIFTTPPHSLTFISFGLFTTSSSVRPSWIL